MLSLEIKVNHSSLKKVTHTGSQPQIRKDSMSSWPTRSTERFSGTKSSKFLQDELLCPTDAIFLSFNLG